ncbi:MAG: 3-phosphoshikimate 1-carboxyvinyltransferase, partial [Clostridia bacterium]|nr:3-phosphoshikimate 1-carboxyvinyltransferase [Clostridia bacterium]
MKAIIRPGFARGTVAAPPSKSMAHRLLICAGLADGESTVKGVDPSEDVLATLDCLEALGATVRLEDGAVFLRGCDPRKSGPALLRCRESGSTLRFMIPLCLLSGQPMRLEGSPTLLSRPLSVYEAICRERGL